MRPAVLANPAASETSASRPSSNWKTVTSRALTTLVKAASWFALCYLGFWLALGIDTVLVRAGLYPLAGGMVEEWHASPFWLTISNVETRGPGAARVLLLSLPFLFDASFLVLLGAARMRWRSGLARVLGHFAGLWMILKTGWQAGLYAAGDYGQFGRLMHHLFGATAAAPAMRIAVTGGLTALLLLAGWLCAGRLLIEWRRPRAEWSVQQPGAVWGTAVLIAPVLLILSGIVDFDFEGLGGYAFLFLGIPGAACLLLALLGLWRPPGRPVRDLPVPGRAAGVTAVCIAVALFSGLGQASRARAWMVEHNLARYASPHFEIRYNPAEFSRQTIEGFAAEHEGILEREAGRLNLPASGVRLRAVLYGDFDRALNVMGKKEPYDVTGTTIRAIQAGYLQQVDPAADAAALLDAVWGEPGTPLLGEWIAAWLAGESVEKSVEKDAAKIQSEVGHYSLTDLFERRSDDVLSPLVRRPLGAAWVQWLAERSGTAGVRMVYSAKISRTSLADLARLLGVPPAKLEAEWQQWTVQLESEFPAPAVPMGRLPAGVFLRGVSLSSESWAGSRGGYASGECAAQIRLLQEMGANAVALVPYGFMRALGEPRVNYVGTDETDLDLNEANDQAHRLGMKVLLKPQIWLPTDAFTGQVRFRSAADRARWMRSYREFILHYARLAEEQRFDMLSIGNELGGMTSDEAAWRDLIAEVRRVYHGPLTYAANWNGEFDSIRFWDALDYAGLNSYFPLAKAAEPRPAELQAGAESLASKLAAFSEKWHRPILFTEVGYPSVRGAAAQPWVEDADHPVSLQEQAACYDAVLRVFPGREWLAGMFWWKWPSDGRGGGADDATYTPLGKPAAEVIRRWYTALAARAAPNPAHP